MKFAVVRAYALGLPEVTEQPHHHFTSFRVRGKIFATAPPDEQLLHLFVKEEQRQPALALHGNFVEKLLWGGKVVGLRVTLAAATPAAVKHLVLQAWESKAPRALLAPAKR